MSKVEIVYALHNFEAENEDEITFQAGEPITVIEKDEKYLDGWWKGRDPRGNVGLFPMNYTTHMKPNNTKNNEIETNNDNNNNNIYDNEMINDNRNKNNSTVSKINIEQANALNNLHTTPSILPETSIPPSSSFDANYTTLPSIKVSSDPNPENWDVNQVCAWLESAGLENVIDIFTEQEITGDVLVELTMDSLKELGISAYGRRYKVMTAINKLNSSKNKSTSQNTLEDINEVENEQSMPKGPVPKVTTSTSRIPHSSQQRDTKYTPSMISTVSTSTSGPSSMNYQSNLSSPIESDNLYQFPRKAPQPPSSASSVTTQDNLRPMSSTSLGSSSNNNISRSNTFNTTSTVLTSKSNETKSSPFSSLKQQHSHDMPRDAAHPRVSMSTPTITSTMNHHDRFQQEMSARINQPADQTLSILSIDSSLQRPSTDEFQAPEHEGWLHKQSDRYKTWNKRWFVLKGTNLFYFKSPKDVRMKGIINLRGYRVIVDETIHSNKYCFKAQHEQERTFFFYTDTADSMRLWIQALMKATIIRDFTSPVMSSNQVATIPLDVAQRMRPRPPSVLLSKTQQINETMQKVDEEDEYEINERNRMENESGISGRSMHKNDRYNTNRNGGDLHDDSDEDVDPFKHEKYTTNNSIPSDTNNNHIQNNNNHRSSIISATTTINNNNHPHPHHKSQREWTHVQYIHWINQYLPEGKKVVDLSSAFRNGDTLIILLETLSGKKVRRNPDQKGGSVSMKVLDSIVNAFKFMGVNGVVVNGNYTIKDIFGGNEEKIMDMVDAIKTWADVNGYGEKPTIKEEGEDTSSSIVDEDEDEESAYNTVATTNEKNSNFSMILPETPVDHEGFSKSFFNETLHHMKDSNPQHPQHVA
ncbi:unnamed protein product [Cunninghamella blakesleeana]